MGRAERRLYVAERRKYQAKLRKPMKTNREVAWDAISKTGLRRPWL